MADEVLLLDVVEDVRAYFEYLKHLGVDSLALERPAGGLRKPEAPERVERGSSSKAVAGGRGPGPRFQRRFPTTPPPGPARGARTKSAGPTLADYGPSEVPTLVGLPLRDEGGQTQPRGVSSGTRSSRIESLRALEQSLEGCARCDRAQQRTRVVMGSGNIESKLLLVGDVPDGVEDREGRPFLGEVGDLLDRILKTMLDLERSDVYLVNVIRCHHPSRKSASLEELAVCSTYLEEQIRIIEPQIIIALGEAAAQTLLKTQAPFSTLRGRWFQRGSALVIPTFHPAELILNVSKKRAVRDDMLQVKARMVSVSGE